MSQLEEFESDAIVAVRTLGSRGVEHLLAEADLAVSLEDAGVSELLNTCIAELGASEAIRVLWDRFPATCALYLTDAGRREYDHGALYPSVQEELGLTHTQVIRWGNRLLDFIDEIGLWRFWSEDVTRYRLESILMHGGLPDDAWSQIWRALILPATDRLLTERDADDVIELAVSESWAAPQLRKTTVDIIANGGDMVSRLVSNALRAARLVRMQGFVDTADDYGLPPAALVSLQALLDAPRILWPELLFDESRTNPVTLACPSQTVPKAPFRQGLQVRYDMYSSVDEGKLLAHDEIPAVVRGADLRIEKSTLPVQATTAFDVIARFSGIDRSGATREKRLRWRAATDFGVWIFPKDRKGRYACPATQDRQRPYTEAVYLSPSGVKLTAAGGATVVEARPVAGEWGGWTAYSVTAPQGGFVQIHDDDGNTSGDLPIGQTCAISLPGDDAATIGSLIAGQTLVRVYGRQLPAVRIVPIDLTEPLCVENWSCCIEWSRAGALKRVDVPLDLSGPYEITGDLGAVAPDLDDMISGGVIRVTGPRRAGGLVRRFVRVPISAAVPVSISDGDSFRSMCATYLLESYGEPLRDIGRSVDVHVDTSQGHGKYLISAPLEKATLALTVRHDDLAIPMNLDLLGIEVSTQDINPLVLESSRVPMALLQRSSVGFIRIHCEARSNATVCLRAVEGGDAAVLRSVGTNGRFTEVVGLAELQTLARDSIGLRVELNVSAGALDFTRQLMEIVPGVGLSGVEIRDNGAGVSVTSVTPALLPVSCVVRDLTRPWREAATGTLSPGGSDVGLAPKRYELHVGKYGLWLDVEDEWGTPEFACSGEPDQTMIVRPDEHHDPSPSMGPYMTGLTELLLHEQDLGPRPRIGTAQKPPALGMLEMDAAATVWAALSSLRKNRATAAQFGSSVMNLRTYRYAMCPPVLRAFNDPALATCVARGEALACMCVLNLPSLPVRAANSGAFAQEELEAAWRTEPFLGLLTSQLHALSGDAALGRAAVSNWLVSVNLDRARLREVWRELAVCRLTVAEVVQGKGALSTTGTSRTLTTLAFIRWHADQTTKSQLEVSQWLKANIEGARRAVKHIQTKSDHLKPIADAISARDPGEYCKRIEQLPFMIGALALVAAARAHRDPAADGACSFIGGSRAVDVDGTGAAQLLVDACTLALPILSLDMTLVRLSTEVLLKGDVV